MTQFKVGDRVKVVKPSYVVDLQSYRSQKAECSNSWVGRMDPCIGNIYEIEDFDSGGFYLEGVTWQFLPEWLVPVEQGVKYYEDTDRLLWLVRDVGVDIIGGVDIHQEASIYASVFGREEPNDNDYIAAIRTAIDKAMGAE